MSWLSFRTSRIAATLLPSAFARNTGLLAAGTAAGQLLVLLASPILTRLYSPADFGVLTMFVAVLATAAIASGLRFEAAIPLEETDRKAAAALALSLAVMASSGILVAAVAYGILAAAANGGMVTIFGEADKYRNLLPYAWMLAPGIWALGGFQAANYWAVRRRAFSVVARSKLTQAIVTIAVQMGLALAWTPVPAGLLIGFVGGYGVAAISLLVATVGRGAGVVGSLRPATLRQTAGRNARFAYLSSPASLLNNAGINLAPLLLGMAFSLDAAGLFGLSRRVLGIPVSLVGRAVGQVYYGEASRCLHEAPAQLPDLFRETVQRMALFIALPLVVIGAPASMTFSFVFGESWAPAGEYALRLLPAIAMQCIVSPVAETAYVCRRQGVQLGLDIARVVVVVASISGARWIGLPASVAVLCYSLGMTLVYAMSLFAYARMIRRA